MAKKSKYPRTVAIDILGILEDMLDKKGIKIPDSHRIGDEDEACLYGETYYELEDKITELLENVIIIGNFDIKKEKNND